MFFTTEDAESIFDCFSVNSVLSVVGRKDIFLPFSMYYKKV